MADPELRKSVMNMLLSEKQLSSQSMEETKDGPKINEQEDKGEILERLSSLEHDQWIEWAKNILETENITEERAERWKELFIPYTDLSEEDKEKDRIWARKVLKLVGNKPRETKDLSSSLSKVFENTSIQEIEDLDTDNIEDDIRKALGTDIRKDIFEAMF